MTRHGSKIIQAVTNTNVPQFTLVCGRRYNPRFLFSWPHALFRRLTRADVLALLPE